jgi:hypothetical protein
MFPEGMKALYEDASLSVELSHWGSLETPQYQASIPGVSRAFQSKKRRFAYSILGAFGFPVERAYDTITIGRKL